MLKRTIKPFIFLVALLSVMAYGIVVLQDRKYYFVSMVMVLLSLAYFAASFERRAPTVREVVVIAVLAALGVAGRIAFYMLPQFKPILAIVIISGVAFGSESGFLVGALSAFVSNFFFGQGPWTPWQMFCMGLIGLLAGRFYYRRKTAIKPLRLAVFGFLTTLFVYGGIINIGSVSMFTKKVTVEAILASYVSALFFDLVHASATFLFLLILTNPLLEKLNRVKTKYGLLDN
ncbi:ECF transporter S component [Fusibacter sp. JL298sf-3]